MINTGSSHELCAFILWEAEAERKQLQMENAMLRGEIERLKKGEPALKEAPPPQEKADG
jgi:cell division protein FtsB